MNITFPLTNGQQEALRGFQRYILNKTDNIWVLSGYSGCGKSTLVNVMLERLPDFLRVARTINPNLPNYEVVLTATTNKAAENLRQITGQDDVRTIHSTLKIGVQTDYKTRKTKLVPRGAFQLVNCILFIDEASKIDLELMRLIRERTKDCKIVLIGDPAQLLSVGSPKPPAFTSGYPGAALTEVVRHEGPILDLATQFRHTVNTGEWPKFRPDGHHVQWLDQDAFCAKMLEEFNRPDWKFSDSKFLAWTNKCVDGCNKFVREHVQGEPELQTGDYAVVNKYVQAGKSGLQTDRMVHISFKGPEVEELGVPGHRYRLDEAYEFFMPKSLELRNARIKQAKKEEDLGTIATIDSTWIDLRACYAQTTDKAQGSTYDRVFIDLNDISSCHNGDQVARMLYVAVSRARNQVFLTGDIA
jgi:energy-coupling factor transporter ATP-binding protein EcfA2